MRIITKAINALLRICQFLLYSCLRFAFRPSKRKWNIEIDLNDFSRVGSYESAAFSEGLRRNALYPAGVKYCFKTEASSTRIKVIYRKKVPLRNMSSFESACLDLYERENGVYSHVAVIGPKNRMSMTAKYDYVKSIDQDAECILYLCSYAQVAKILIEADEPVFFDDSLQGECGKIVVYGSSISQGCAASRPGLSYANIVAREMDCDLVNYGFSESAKGEKKVSEMVALQPADIFILEYDHNATLEELEQTHYSFYRQIRVHNPGSKIVLISRFSGGLSIPEQETLARRNIIRTTYDRAKSDGDMDIVFIDGSAISKEDQNSMFADDRHPNDYGMRLIADLILDQVEICRD